MVSLHTMSLLFFPLEKASGTGQAAWYLLKENFFFFEAKASHLKVGLFLQPGWKFMCGETKETTFERLHMDQIIESDTVLLYFKNNKTWQVMGAHPGLIALGIN